MNPANELYVPGYRIRVPHSSILYFEADCNYTRIYCRGGKSYFCSTTLKKFMAACPTFLRVSKSAAINPAFIKQFKTDTLTMDNGQKLVVSRRRRVLFKNLSQCIA